ncbi:hypothetical protein E2493_17930 [Sphingomonas parva]|uniref:Uncharacterized protein n=1 Tax=Sphingomonas parva TaxID=2555898 RepID=A0A4Y8ZLP5_9SPHN|nr:hypothetical protein [Sphingomonas parva]TFI56884.1 hypothetical protein E2493_17930 [Sphingomonas parva]
MTTTCEVTIETAERTARARAILMTLAAVVLLVSAALEYGEPAYGAPGARGAGWVVVLLLWLFLLWNGGGLRLRAAMRGLINDELSLQNRSRALAFGFFAGVLAGVAVYFAGWRTEIAAADAIRLPSSIAVAAALLRYAWLESR